MTLKKKAAVLLTALLCGLVVSWMYVNPYGGRLSLSELILQLSGSSGTFPLGCSLFELTSFSVRMIPSYIFESFLGLYFYQRFCTASVYILSRYPNRNRWYMSEMMCIAWYTVLFNAAELTGTILTALCRYQIVVNAAGIELMVYHLVFYSLWMWNMCMILNLMAVYRGSAKAFTVVAGVQIVLTAALCIGSSDSLSVRNTLIKMNPIAHLVLGWHADGSKMTDWGTETAEWSLSLNGSLVLFLVLSILVLTVGCCLINRYELLISDVETGY